MSRQQPPNASNNGKPPHQIYASPESITAASLARVPQQVLYRQINDDSFRRPERVDRVSVLGLGSLQRNPPPAAPSVVSSRSDSSSMDLTGSGPYSLPSIGPSSHHSFGMTIQTSHYPLPDPNPADDDTIPERHCAMYVIGCRTKHWSYTTWYNCFMRHFGLHFPSEMYCPIDGCNWECYDDTGQSVWDHVCDHIEVEHGKRDRVDINRRCPAWLTDHLRRYKRVDAGKESELRTTGRYQGQPVVETARQDRGGKGPGSGRLGQPAVPRQY